MNSLSGRIAHIRVSGSLSLVSVDITENITLKSIVIETPDTAPYLTMGNQINVLFNETEVVIGIGEKHAISLQNAMKGLVTEIERGELIGRVTVRTEAGEIVAVISTNAIDQLGLRENLEVMTMVKLNEIMLSE